MFRTYIRVSVLDMKHSLIYEDYRINKSIIFLSSLFKKLIDNDSEDFNLNLAYSINFNKKIKSGRTLRTHLPEDIEDKVISEINKCSIIIIKNKYSIPLVGSYKIKITSMFFKLQVELTKEEDKVEKLLKCKDINDTNIEWRIVNWDLLKNRRRK